MLTEPLPINIFVRTRFNETQTLAVIEKWRVERQMLENMVIEHFQEMGMFSVAPLAERECLNIILHILQHSPAIYAVVKKAEDWELRRKANRNRDSS